MMSVYIRSCDSKLTQVIQIVCVQEAFIALDCASFNIQSYIFLKWIKDNFLFHASQQHIFIENILSHLSNICVPLGYRFPLLFARTCQIISEQCPIIKHQFDFCMY